MKDEALVLMNNEMYLADVTNIINKHVVFSHTLTGAMLFLPDTKNNNKLEYFERLLTDMRYNPVRRIVKLV